MKRIHITIPTELTKQLKNQVPPRLRSAVFTSVFRLISNAIDQLGPGVIGLILAGEIKLTANDTMRQILTPTDKAEKDGQQAISPKAN